MRLHRHVPRCTETVTCLGTVRWGLELLAFHCSPAHESPVSGYVPDLCWLVAASPAAVVVAFRGADPFTQVSALLNPSFKRL